MAVNIKSKLSLRSTNRRNSLFAIFTLVLVISSLFVGVFTPKTEGQTDVFTVTANGSFAEVSGAGEYSAGATVTLNAGIRTGYAFSRWTVNSGSVSLSSTTGTTTTFTMPSNNVVITASWTAVQYSISYTLNGGYAAGNPSLYNADNSFPITITNPTRTSYDFSGWNVTYADGTQKSFQISYSIPEGTTGNIALTANWKDPNDGKRFTVTVDDAHGTPTGTGSYYFGDTVTLNAGIQNGYTFSHWAVKGWVVSLPSNPTVTFTMPASNVDVTAVWRSIGFKINYLLFNEPTYAWENVDNPMQYSADDSFPITIANPIRKDHFPLDYEYRFLGWNVTYADGTQATFQTSYSIPAGTLGDITLEANWASKSKTQEIKEDVIWVGIAIGVIIGILVIGFFVLAFLSDYRKTWRENYDAGRPVPVGGW
ncbi:MAG: InlB B-repeat-containing protein [Candidatus Bathyarchaeota archaeon]|uniref:InlB B-repeat-containing protein n=1 Tax=Candidatus Bathycorpusculum sp. TaxID=2994959 RepID=UPI00281CF915|nr:InlB B-repeat-containing protein [Candidatus Termiticorpusculum sp.]